MGKKKNEEIKSLKAANKSLKVEIAKLYEKLKAQNEVHEEKLDLEEEKPLKELTTEKKEENGSGKGESRVQESGKEAISEAFADEASKWQRDLPHTKNKLQTLAKELRGYLEKDITGSVERYKEGQIDAGGLINQVDTLSSLFITCKNILNDVADEPNENLDDHDQSNGTQVYELVEPDEADEAADKSARADLVLVAWDPATENFQIIRGNDTSLYFLDPECYEELGLIIANDQLNMKLCLAEVVSQRACTAPESSNPFHVPEMTRFYQVQVKKPSTVEQITAPGIAIITRKSKRKQEQPKQHEEQQQQQQEHQEQGLNVANNEESSPVASFHDAEQEQGYTCFGYPI